ncbi:MAG: hypothetical protein K0Q59_2524 [Paenibacillus sp.]|nr:hypothetical protein [Paenibacillus sp.]
MTTGAEAAPVLFGNEYLRLVAEGDQVFVEVFQSGYPFKDFELILRQVPRLQLTQFGNLRSAIFRPTGEPTEIGVLKPLIELSVSNDYMEATVRVNATTEQLEENRSAIVKQTVDQLNAEGVCEGVMYDVLSGDLPTQQDVVIARGIEPQPGRAAEITMFQLSERRPTIREDGSTDHYELNLIDEVQPGDWLGEKIPATWGTSGRNLKGAALPPQSGLDKPLKYDPKTVVQQEENGKLVLRSLVNGAVTKIGDKIAVQELLIIKGDVGPQTGRIDYDGSVQVTGTVHDGYSIKATKDISILGELGIGAVDRIESATGDIYIKGGVFGKERAVIQAEGHVYIKHAKDCTIVAKEHIHIGLYAINCILHAKHIHLDKRRGRLIGGHVHAEVQLVTAFIGTEAERPTRIQVEGFDRSQIMQKLSDLLQRYKTVLETQERLRKEINIYQQFYDSLTDQQKEQYNQYTLHYEAASVQLMELEELRRQLMAYISAKGEGEVAVMQKAFPRTTLQIKELEKHIERTMAGSFYVDNNQLFHQG